MKKLVIICSIFVQQFSFGQNQYTVTVDPSTVLNPDVKKILGMSFDGRSSMSINNGSFGYHDPASGQMLLVATPQWDKMPMQTVRYPGNPVVYNWDWRKTIGPLANRTPQVLLNSLPAQSIAFGFDEFMAMCKAKGMSYADVQLMVNLYTIPGYPNPADLAADWVEYCNAPNDCSNPRGGIDWAAKRAEYGHPEPYGVQIWNVGNEPWTYQEQNTSVFSPADYVTQSEAIIDSMLKVDPGIKITIPFVGLSTSPWNSGVLDPQITTKIYGVSPHAFYDNLSGTNNPDPNLALSELALIQNMVKPLGLKIVLGDHAFNNSTSYSSVGAQWGGTLTSCTFLLGMTQLSEVERANYWIFGNANNASTYHPIRKNPNGSFTFMALAQLYESFEDYFEEQSVATTMSPVNNSSRAAAFYKADGTAASVIVMNSDAALAHSVNIPQLSGMQLYEVLKITAASQTADQSTTTAVFPNTNGNYDLPAASVLVFRYVKTTSSQYWVKLNKNIQVFESTPGQNSAYQKVKMNGVGFLPNMSYVVSVPAPFTICKTYNGNYASNFNVITDANGKIPLQNLYIRYAGQSANTLQTGLLTVSKGLTTYWSVALSGTTVPALNPQLFFEDPNNLQFHAQSGVMSDPNKFNFNGQDIFQDVLVTPPADYEISLTEHGTYFTSLNFANNCHMEDMHTVYIRYNPAICDQYNADVVVSSGLVTPIAITLESYCDKSAGLADQSEAVELSVYPNPLTGDEFQIVLPGFGKQLQIALFDLTGKKVDTPLIEAQHGTQFSCRIQHQQLPAGSYVLRVTDVDGNTKSFNFIR